MEAVQEAAVQERPHPRRVTTKGRKWWEGEKVSSSENEKCPTDQDEERTQTKTVTFSDVFHCDFLSKNCIIYYRAHLQKKEYLQEQCVRVKMGARFKISEG